MILSHPFAVFALSLVALWLAALLGAALGRRWKLEDDRRDDFGIILAATLTLLGLIIGFTFSLATNRYDQRKNTRRRKPMRSARNTFVPICSRRPMQRE